MSKLHRRSYLAISTIATASALLTAAPASAPAAEAAAEPSGGSTQPGASEWSQQGSEEGTSDGGNASLVHGSSVGSGAVTHDGGADTEKAASDSGQPSYAPPPDSGASYEAEPSTSSTVDESASTPRAPSGAHSVHPTAKPAPAPVKKSRPVYVAVGAATSLGRSVAFRDDGASSSDSDPPAAAPVGTSGDHASLSSYVLPLLLVIAALGLILGFASARIRRHRRRERLEAQWREQEAAWEPALRQAELIRG